MAQVTVNHFSVDVGGPFSVFLYNRTENSILPITKSNPSKPICVKLTTGLSELGTIVLDDDGIPISAFLKSTYDVDVNQVATVKMAVYQGGHSSGQSGYQTTYKLKIGEMVTMNCRTDPGKVYAQNVTFHGLC
jgi:hypothetical protein